MRYFISGHRNISKEIFEKYYIPKISRVILEDPNPEFLVGDYEGADYMAQEYLNSIGMGDKTTVYHMYTSPRNYIQGLKCIPGFKSDEERDAAMTNNSDFDIAFYEKKRGWSGTLTNIVRRWGLLSILVFFLGCTTDNPIKSSYTISVSFIENNIKKDTTFLIFPPDSYYPDIMETKDGKLKIIYYYKSGESSGRLNDGPVIGKGSLVKFSSVKYKNIESPKKNNWWRDCYEIKP